MEEVWSVEEVDFNIKGLSMDCFLPPADLKKEDEDEEDEECGVVGGGGGKNIGGRILGGGKCGRRVVAIDEDMEM